MFSLITLELYMLPIFALLGYLAAVCMGLLLMGLLIVGKSTAIQARLLIVASLTNVGWALVMAWQIRFAELSNVVLFASEILRYWGWLLFLNSTLWLSDDRAFSGTLGRATHVAPGVIFLAVMLSSYFGVEPGATFVTGSLALVLMALAILERIYRNVDPAARRSIGYLTLAIGGLFGYDLVMLSSSVLFGQIDPGLWSARGVANAAVVPLLILAARRNHDWSVDMFVSRQVAYFSFTMVGAGIYLILMAVGGYYVKELGGSIGNALAALLIFGAVLGGAVLLLSEQLRRRVRVFFAKHFFSNRYDYREEWQRLSKTLYDPKDERSLGERSIEAAARIMNSHSGILLLQREGPGSPMLPFAAWRRNLPESLRLEPSDGLVQFLQKSNWVIDTREYADDPDKYALLGLPDWLEEGEQRIVVPLLQGNDLIGVLLLDQVVPVSLNFEDTDLLKIVGRQVAGLLLQELDADRLAEGRQFQAYSRLTAFLMHDLKNLAAQQSLVVKNAAKHKRNPDFVDDAFETIEHSVNRMNRLIAQLAERNRKEQRKRVVVSDVLHSVIQQVSDRRPVPTVAGDLDDIRVQADHERLAAIFTHLIRNAQDACDDDGEIQIAVASSNTSVDIAVRDDGNGMDDTFIRERLFKPFESTKGADGMGIGAYQVREYVKELDGHLHVDSASGVGTKVLISLPRAM